MSLAVDADAMILPSRENARREMISSRQCDELSTRHGDLTLHRCTASSEPETTVFPSGEKSKDETDEVPTSIE